MAREKVTKPETGNGWIKVSHKELVDALAAMKKCVPAENLAPTQVAVLDEQTSTIRCSNLEVGMCLRLSSMAGGTSEIIVPREELLKLLRASTPKGDKRFAPVLLRQKEEGADSPTPLVELVDVDGDSCELETPCPMSELPKTPVFDPGKNEDGPVDRQWTIEDDPLKTLKWLHFAVGHDETRNNLMQIRLGKDSQAVATDGHRMHVATLPDSGGNGFDTGIPSCALTAVEAMVKWFDEPAVRVQKQGDDGGFARGLGSAWTVVWNYCEEQFPEYNHPRIVPVLFNHTAFEDVEKLRRALNKLIKSGAAIHNEVKDATAKLSIDGGEFVLESAGHKRMRIKVSGALLDDKMGDRYIGFNPRYMLEALEVFGDGPVRVQFEDAGSPIRIDSTKDIKYTALVMPKRLD